MIWKLSTWNWNKNGDYNGDLMQLNGLLQKTSDISDSIVAQIEYVEYSKWNIKNEQSI